MGQYYYGSVREPNCTVLMTTRLVHLGLKNRRIAPFSCDCELDDGSDDVLKQIKIWV